MHGLGIHRRLFEAAQGGGVDGLVKTAFDSIGLPLVLMDAACFVIVKYPLDEQPGCEHWNSYSPGEQVPSTFINTAWREGHMPRLHGSNEPVFIDWGFAEKEPRLTQELRWQGVPMGYLLALVSEGTYEERQMEGMRALGETATFMLSMRGQNQHVRAPFVNALFHGLLSGSLNTQMAIDELAESSRMDLVGRFVVIAVSGWTSSASGLLTDAPLLLGYDDSSVLPYLDGNVLYLLVSKLDGSFAESAQRVKAKRLVDGLEAQCGVSRPFESLLELRDYRWQAQKALELGGVFEPGETMHYFGKHALAAIVSEASSHIPRLAFLHPALQAISDYDSEHETDLGATMAAYLACDQDASKAAKMLHIHKNTLRYRLERIAEIGRFDFNDSYGKTHMHLSLIYEKLHGGEDIPI